MGMGLSRARRGRMKRTARVVGAVIAVAVALAVGMPLLVPAAFPAPFSLPAAAAATGGSISGTAYMDLNRNLAQDAGEAATAGLVVNLLDSSGGVVATTTTDASGAYSFTGVSAGTYTVQMVCTTSLTNTFPGCGFASNVTADNQFTASGSSSSQATGKTAAITLADGQALSAVDAAVQPTRVRLTGTVWNDWNGNSVQDAGEPGLAGAQVALASSTGQVFATGTTDANGKYTFDAVATAGFNPTGTRLIYAWPNAALPAESVSAPNRGGSFPATTYGSTAQVNGVPVRAIGENIYAPSYGINLLTPGATVTGLAAWSVPSVSGTVWQDSDRDQVRDSTETRASGVKVNLLDSTGAVVATTTTAADGTYKFGTQPPGNYRVQVVAPGGWTFPTSAGRDDKVSLDAPASPQTGSAPVTVTAGQTATAVDAGLVPPTNNAIQGFVWADNNSDGSIGPSSTEPPQAGVQVQLQRADGTVVATTTTSPNGFYGFSSVPAGDYKVVVTAPTDFTFGSSVNHDNGVIGDANNTTSYGSPYKGTSPVFSYNGSGTYAGPDAGLLPLGNLSLMPVQYPTGTACDNLAVTGTGPFDATTAQFAGSPVTSSTSRTNDGTDASASNCTVRMGDVTTQQFSVKMDNIPTGGVVHNVVVDFTVKSTDGGRLQVQSLPAGCGGDSSIDNSRADQGIVVVHCNVGDMDRNAKQVTLAVTSLASSFDGSTFQVTAQARTENGEAPPTAPVTGPVVQITGVPAWDMRKFTRGPNPASVSTQTINGTSQQGFVESFRLQLVTLGGTSWSKGNAELGPSINFTDQLADWPNAVAMSCTTPGNATDTVSCGAGTTQPSGGWDFTLTSGHSTLNYYDYVDFTVFIPAADVYQKMQPGWTTGMPAPVASINSTNTLSNTTGWKTPAGQLNNGTGYEPGWDGTTSTGNDTAPFTLQSTTPPPPPGGGGGSGSNAEPGMVGYKTNEARGAFGSNLALDQLLTPSSKYQSHVQLNLRGPSTITNPVLCDVFDVGTQKLDGSASLRLPSGYLASDWVIEYAVGQNTNDMMTSNTVVSTYPYTVAGNTSDVSDCASNTSRVWSTDPSTFGANWQDKVNMVRMRLVDPTHAATGPGATATTGNSWLGNTWNEFSLLVPLTDRNVYNGGPHAGTPILDYTTLYNAGAWSGTRGSGTGVGPNSRATVVMAPPTTNASGDYTGGWTRDQYTERYIRVVTTLSKTVSPNTSPVGGAVQWTLTPSVTQGDSGTLHHPKVVDPLPAGVTYDAACTNAHTPAGVTVSYDPSSRTVTWTYPDFTYTAPSALALPSVIVCTTTDSSNPVGTVITNKATLTSDEDATPRTAQAAITIVGQNLLRIDKSVDKNFVQAGEQYTWTVKWTNDSGASYANPDLIDVLPYNGDFGGTSGRSQYSTNISGTNALVGPVAQPTYLACPGKTGQPVPGTLYYTTAASDTIVQNPQDAANANPGTPGSIWVLGATITDWSKVTGVRFVSAEALNSHCVATEKLTQAGSGWAPGDGAVNRAEIATSSLPDQPIRSNEPYVQEPQFSIGDLVWLDTNHDGKYTPGVDKPLSGVPIQIIDANGDVVATTTTNAEGRWFVTGLPEGTYHAHIPASAFQSGGPLAGATTDMTGSTGHNGSNEDASNKNVVLGNPAVVGLDSAPTTLAIVRDANGNIIGGNAPLGDDVDNLQASSNPAIPDSMTDMTLDLDIRYNKPMLTTKASTNTAAPGAMVADRVTLAGLAPGHTVAGSATLYGPFASLAKASCTADHAVATVNFRGRNGTVTTPSVKVGAVGYYTWVAKTKADIFDVAATHRCGQANETVHVVKAPLVNTGLGGAHRAAYSGRYIAAGVGLIALGLAAMWLTAARTRRRRL